MVGVRLVDGKMMQRFAGGNVPGKVTPLEEPFFLMCRLVGRLDLFLHIFGGVYKTYIRTTVYNIYLAVSKNRGGPPKSSICS